MKITKTQKDCFRETQVRNTALAGCDRCPCCGENRTTLSYLSEGVHNKGIPSGMGKD